MLTYTLGEMLSLTGLSVKLLYNDNTNEVVSLADFASKSISTTPVDGTALNMSYNGTSITVSCGIYSVNTNTLMVNRMTPVVNWPTGLTATYGQTLSDISLTSFSNSGLHGRCSPMMSATREHKHTT